MSRQYARAIIIRDGKLLAVERYKDGQHYFALPGGEIDKDETKEQALVRELQEEATLTVTNLQHVYTEEMGEPFGTQYIYVCGDPGGEPILRSDSIEAKLNRQGQQSFALVWLPISDLASVPLMSPKIKAAILNAVKNTFPDQPVVL